MANEQIARFTETTDSQMPAYMREDPRGEYVRFEDVKHLIKDRNTRPAAPVEGLETVGWFNPWNEYHGYQQVAPEYEGKGDTVAFVTRSQAEAIIEMQADSIDKLQRKVHHWQDKHDTLETQLAAMKKAFLSIVKQWPDSSAAKTARAALKVIP